MDIPSDTTTDCVSAATGRALPGRDHTSLPVRAVDDAKASRVDNAHAFAHGEELALILSETPEFLAAQGVPNAGVALITASGIDDCNH